MTCPYIGRLSRTEEPYETPSYNHVCYATQTSRTPHSKVTLQWQEGYCLGGAFRGCPRYQAGHLHGIVPPRLTAQPRRRFQLPFFSRREEEAISA